MLVHICAPLRRLKLNDIILEPLPLLTVGEHGLPVASDRADSAADALLSQPNGYFGCCCLMVLDRIEEVDSLLHPRGNHRVIALRLGNDVVASDTDLAVGRRPCIGASTGRETK